MKRTIPAVVALLSLSLGFSTVAPALASKKKHKASTQIVRIADNYYYAAKNHTAPFNVKIHSGDSVKWMWPSDVGDTHDVNLGSGPRGQKAWASPAFAARADYKRTFKTPGVYQLYCSFHTGEMVMSVTVTK